MIKNVIFDVDGVFTTGQFIYTKKGKVAKIFGPHDFDGIKLIRNIFNVMVITGDKRGFEITKKRIKDDMGLPLKLVVEEDRLNWMKNHFNLTETVFMGDGIYDSLVFKHVAYGIAPSNAFFLAKKRASFVTSHISGEGAVAEACLHIIKKFSKSNYKKYKEIYEN